MGEQTESKDEAIIEFVADTIITILIGDAEKMTLVDLDVAFIRNMNELGITGKDQERAFNAWIKLFDNTLPDVRSLTQDEAGIIQSVFDRMLKWHFYKQQNSQRQQ